MNTILLRDRFRILETVGRGGQGEVHRAQDLLHKRQVAVKVRRLLPGEEDRVFGEARVLFGVTPHANLVVVREDHIADDRYLLVMDWIEGESLAQRVVSGPVPYLEALRILSAVGSALDHLHEHDPPVVHGDVKPANVIDSPGRGPVLVDFGLAGGGAYGTIAYRAPEAVLGKLSPASDIYGLAATAHALLEGGPPDDGELPDLEGVPESLRDRVLEGLRRGLAYDPSRRPSSAGELVALLSPIDTPTNLPSPLSSFVGRESELASLRKLLEETRLITLAGPAGVGKTRLARELGKAALYRFPEGVWWTELSPLADPSLVPDSVAATLRALGPEPDAITRIVSAIAEGHVLLILDNAEHLLAEAGRTASSLLTACPNLKILVTSREPLGLPGESVWEALPLPLPDEADTARTVERADAVKLFCVRAKPRFTPAEGDWPLVSRLCRRLDGLPLAIEMAAARVPALGLVSVDKALNERFELLAAGPGTHPRHRTLQAALDWSHDLLTEAERVCFRRLSVFAGPFDVDAAQAVCVLAEPKDAIQEPSIIPDLLESLADKSLVARAGTEVESRYRLLESTRDYATDKLRDAKEEEAVRRLHATHFLSVIERAGPNIRAGTQQAQWLDRLEAVHDDCRAALGWSLGADPEIALSLARGLTQMWRIRGYLSEAKRWLDAALSANAGTRSRLVAQALVHAGAVACDTGDLETARNLAKSAIEIFGESDDLANVAVAQSLLGVAAESIDESLLIFKDELRTWRQLGNEWQIARVLVRLARTESHLGHYTDARQLYADALDSARKVEDRLIETSSMTRLGFIANQLGELRQAEQLLTDGLELARQDGQTSDQPEILRDLGNVVRERGDFGGARALFEESLEMDRRSGAALSRGLLTLADVAMDEDDLAEARSYVEAALDEAIPVYSPYVALVRGRLAIAEGDFAAARACLKGALEGGDEGDWQLIAGTHRNLAEVDVAMGDHRSTLENLRKALELTEPSAILQVVRTLDGYAAALNSSGDNETAAFALGAADAIYERTGAVRPPVRERKIEKTRRSLLAAIGSPLFHETWEAGRSATFEQIAVRLRQSTVAVGSSKTQAASAEHEDLPS